MAMLSRVTRLLMAFLLVSATVRSQERNTAFSSTGAPSPNEANTALGLKSKRVVVLTEVGISSPAIASVDHDLYTGLQESPYRIEFYSEYLETSLSPDGASQADIQDSFIRTYQLRKPDVIVTVGPTPTKVMVDAHERFFPGVPIVFCCSSEYQADYPKLDAHFTGAWLDFDTDKTVQLALRLLPKTNQVVVVGGTSSFDQHLLGEVKKAQNKYEARLQFTYLTNLPLEEIVDRVKRLSSDAIVLFTSLQIDGAGKHFNASAGPIRVLAAAADAPVFTLADTLVGQGAVGGYVVRYIDQGKVAAGITRNILKGASPREIGIGRENSAYLFDWRALQRWGIKERSLPPGSLVLYRQPGFFELYWRYILVGVLLLALQALIIGGLLWQRTQRKKTQTELARSNEQLRLAMQSGKTVGWDWDVRTGRDFWFGDLAAVFGIPSETFIGRVGDFFRYVHPEDRQGVSEGVADARRSHKPYVGEYRILWPDGTTRWLVSRGKFEYAANGDATRMLGIAVDITERKRVEEALKNSEEKFSKAFRQSPATLSITSARDHRYIEVNQTFERLMGYSREQIIGRTPFDLGTWVDSSQRIEVVKRVLAEGGIYDIVLPFRGKDGQIWIGSSSFELVEIDREPCVLAITTDITERQRAEAALRESEERFRRLANTAPVMIWMSNADGLGTYVNEPWLEFTRRSVDEELGNGWMELLHPEDVDKLGDTFSKAAKRREAFQNEHRLRRYDGEYRWVLGSGVPRFDADGSFAGYIGTAIDITERKLAEEALSTVSQRLIEAQEEERRRIARELHDDIDQRLALLAVKLDELQESPGSKHELSRGIEEAKTQLEDVARDIQALSHRLHSSKLEYLGLEGAAASFCRELSDRQRVKIDFDSSDISKDLPKEISLCLFRVLQEALQNAIKHSSSRQFQVSFIGGSTEVELTVRDSGVGFDPEVALRGRGLGLTSIRERLKLVNGALSIHSQLERGTTIQARVPLNAQMKSARAAG